jgi:hypothetical protein
MKLLSKKTLLHRTQLAANSTPPSTHVSSLCIVANLDDPTHVI